MKKQCKLFLMLILAVMVAMVACKHDKEEDGPGGSVAGWEDVLQIATDVTNVTASGKYRDNLANHPGCEPRESYADQVGYLTSGVFDVNQLAPLAGTQASIPGYLCAAKEYTVTSEDKSKPVVILVHGNSESPDNWEDFLHTTRAGESIVRASYTLNVDAQARKQLATQLVEAGYRTIAVDFRVDKVATQTNWNSSNIDGDNYENPNSNFDHGWAVPILQNLVKSVMNQIKEEGRDNQKIVLIGHSLGVTTMRDTLRRMFLEYFNKVDGAVNPWPQVDRVIGLHGANHGVSTADGSVDYCQTYKSMRGTVVCEMGSRANYSATEFHKPINGLNGIYETPCLDGDVAYDTYGYCKNTVKYITITMQDIEAGKYQDEFVSQASAALAGATNLTIGLNDYDSSGYFFGSAAYIGAFANHYGGPRSTAGIQTIMNNLE